MTLLAELKSIKTGIPKLDNEIGEGFPKKSSILVLSPIDPEFDLYFSDIIDFSIKQNINCICISLLFPEDLEKFLNSPNFYLICGELGTFSEYKDKNNVKLTDTDMEGIVSGFEEVYNSITNNNPIITLVKISSIQFYHGLAPTVTILSMLIELFKRLDISLSLAYLEVDERIAPVLESFEEKFDGCIHFLHGSVGDNIYKFFYIKKLKGISTPFELVHVSKEMPKSVKHVLKETEVPKAVPEGAKLLDSVKELKSGATATVDELMKKTVGGPTYKSAVGELKAELSKTVEDVINKPLTASTATKPITQPATKPMTQAAQVPEVKPLTKPMTQPATKPMTQAAQVPEVKPLTKSMTQPTAKSEVKPATKSAGLTVTGIPEGFSLFKLNDLIDKYWEKIEATAKEKGVPNNVLTDFGWTYGKKPQGNLELKIDEYGKPTDKEREFAKKVSLLIDAYIKKATGA